MKVLLMLFFLFNGVALAAHFWLESPSAWILGIAGSSAILGAICVFFSVTEEFKRFQQQVNTYRNEEESSAWREERLKRIIEGKNNMLSFQADNLSALREELENLRNDHALLIAACKAEKIEREGS